MNADTTSAFAAYAAKKPKKILENKIGFKVKSKHKLKKKNKSHSNNAETVLNTIVNVAESKSSNNLIKKRKKKLLKILLNERKEELFKDCNLVTKVDNMFLENSSLSGRNPKKELKNEEGNKNFDYECKTKKPKKKKVSHMKVLKKQKISNGVEISIDKQENVNGNNEGAKLSIRKKLENFNEIENKVPKIIYCDSVKVGEEILSWLLSPISLTEFFNDCWEQKPLHIKHNNVNYFKDICTLNDFKKALSNHDLYFTRNIDVTCYINGQRFTENPEGKATPSIVWDLYNKGKSIRLLNPQTFISNIRLLNTSLQEFFGCFVGANIYLTPAGTQGFAPHYDDIEALVLQLEGEKHWKLYNPRNEDEVLPRVSSENFKEDEIGEPILEVTLYPGDVLYFPRGIIHQAKCLPHVHSLHITVSCYQKNSWADLFEKLFPVALQKAINEDLEFRKGLPIGYLNHLGMIYSDSKSNEREEIIKKFKKLAEKVIEYCPLDAGADQMGASFMYDAMPPCVSEEEKIYGADRTGAEEKNLLQSLKNSFEESLSVKLIRANSVRLVSEENDIILYYTTDNSLVYHEHEVSAVAVSTNWAQAIDYLIHSYPNFVEMKDLPVYTKSNKPGKWKHIAEFVYFLWQKGLLLFDKPLQQICS